MAGELEHVSDTALWVAFYRAQESERADALFRDPFARRLAGEKGARIAQRFEPTPGRYVRWNVAVRTCVIDELLAALVREGVDTVVNLGAGLDARPYRLDLPPTLQWVEVDYPAVIEAKETLLQGEAPRCRLRRLRADLGDDAQRGRVLDEIAATTRKAVALTEGVIPYLTGEQVARLGRDLLSRAPFQFWIADYNAPFTYRYLQHPSQVKRMGRTPFRFFPAEPFAFFAQLGWKPRETRYLGEESLARGRPVPAPWFARLVLPFLRVARKQFLRGQGYVLYERAQR